MQRIRHFSALALSGLIIFIAILGASPVQAQSLSILNVSYDPTREFYREYNQHFIDLWQKQTGQRINVRQSHGGSGSQAQAVINGLDADVVTLALAYDVDALRQRGNLIPQNWQERLPGNSSPYTSTIVLLVRAGNPKNIQGWDDLIRDDVQVITPNPKTSGGARWNYLAAWGFAEKKYGSQEKAREFMEKLFANVPVLDPAARGATNTFVQRRIGDVFIAWENEAFLSVEQLGRGQYEIIVPSVSILAEPPVTVVDRNVDRKGTRTVAEAYLKELYSDEAQRLAGKHSYRPSNTKIAAEFADRFPAVNFFTIDEMFNGWQNAQETHFSDGGIFDEIQEKIARNRRR
ncbi:sulfate ABC transporter substrate-binding protein [Desulfurispirillum indicum]|uniref:sulfate ABC transporter substrate-binding protein n=1 Tax=Desulfurispirillum indicum TaxID=936456 RepID=UPI001CFBF0C6|nr:sulfate ABC transporter substrate-binding protein [Desulfurispirillum indicum]UCZ57471.1 sulfate ABC transporter substrate-binding protein [Desulfurispirillum indicum]